ncbi:hypothetical protein NQ318_014086 [Aromia moschata]|uniref:ATP-dependent DNA helicase n=1 Tax=Aromia moschata TaxID=1265417 RepID=A0AAV8YYI7_9CUCU|nr:hypothetical protein NQ318_014086 [Aromia moschata]
MNNNDSYLSCGVNIEWLNKQGIVLRKVTHRQGNLRLVRNDSKEMFIEVSANKIAPEKLHLTGISVHKKFMNEGKASIKFQPLNCILYLTNAPPGQLLSFLRTIYIKTTSEKGASNNRASLRTQLLSGRYHQYEEVSPVTNSEIDKARAKISKSTETTPSPQASKKRKLERDSTTKPPAAKKLYSSSPIPNEPLDIEQQEVLDACLQGQNVFFTGSAGTGKSYLLRRIIGVLPPDVTTATASTGVAACHIGGITLHQFAGIGRGEATLEQCIAMASKSVTATIWRRCKHLIIDEISMVDGEYFEKIESVARRIRNNEKPFGGIQLILCGDFFQLPPVTKAKFGDTKAPVSRFCFKTKAWEDCMLRTFELKKVHRQNDEHFISILNKIRTGVVDKEVTNALTATSKQKIERGDILATRLCSHTKDADITNEMKLKALPGESQVFEAQDSVPGTTAQLNQQTTFPSRLELKVGAQVMLLKNISVGTGLVNGARGVIKTFKEGLPVVQFRNKREYVASHEKVTIKTAGGLDAGLRRDVSREGLEAGQAYVALSRAQSLESLRVLDFNPNQVWANPDVLKFYRTLDFMQIIPVGPVNKQSASKSSNVKKGVTKKLYDKPLVSIS